MTNRIQVFHSGLSRKPMIWRDEVRALKNHAVSADNRCEGVRETMPTQLMCPNIKCRKILSVPDEARGKIVRCSHCQTSLRVPPPKEDPKKPAVAAK